MKVTVWTVTWVIDDKPPVVDGFGSEVFTDEEAAWEWAEEWERGTPLPRYLQLQTSPGAGRTTTVESHEIDVDIVT
jgi:hypothetical protein